MANESFLSCVHESWQFSNFQSYSNPFNFNCNRGYIIHPNIDDHRLASDLIYKFNIGNGTTKLVNDEIINRVIVFDIFMPKL